MQVLLDCQSMQFSTLNHYKVFYRIHNNDLSDTETTEVSEPLFTLSTSVVSRNGNSTNLIMVGSSTNPVTVTPNATIIGKIPSKYRPKRAIWITGFWAPTHGGTQTFTVFRITADGNIYYVGSSVAKQFGYIAIATNFGC